jgi:hypothetical protein
MSEVPQIGLPNLVSQGDLVARARAAAVGAERAGNDEIAHELQRIADRRREQVQETERVDALARERRERGERERDPHARYDRLEDEDEAGDDDHLLDVTA